MCWALRGRAWKYSARGLLVPTSLDAGMQAEGGVELKRAGVREHHYIQNSYLPGSPLTKVTWPSTPTPAVKVQLSVIGTM